MLRNVTFYQVISVLSLQGKQLSIEDCLSVLSNGFVKGAAGFLKSGTSELRAIVSASPIREVRVGITQVIVK